MEALKVFLFSLSLNLEFLDLSFELHLGVEQLPAQLLVILPCLASFSFSSSFSLLQFLSDVSVVNLQLLMIFKQLVIVTSTVFKLILQFWDLCLQFRDPSFEEFLFRLCEFGLFLFRVYHLLHFLIEVPLDVLESLLMLSFVFIEHLLIHEDLLGEGLFNPVTLLLDLADSVLE
jgi:hypothetical protein